MRLIIMLVILTAAISACTESDKTDNIVSHPEAYATRKLPLAYFVPVSALSILNDSGEYVTMRYGRINERYFLIIPGDTFTYKYWYECSVPSWHDTIQTQIHNTGKIYDLEEVNQVVLDNYDQDSTTSYLLNCVVDSSATIEVCELIPTQLDTDMEREYVVEYKADGFTNRHFIFDDSSHHFRYHGVQNIGSRYDDHPIDTSLPGYFGLLEESLWGTGVHELTVEYFRLTPDSTIFCFPILQGHTEFMYSEFGEDYDPIVAVTATPRILSDGKVKITYDMSLELFLFDDTQVVFRYSNRFVKTISKIDSMQPGQNSEQAEFQTPPAGWDAVDTLMSELAKLKINGTKKQKFYLRHFSN